ncbi:hypothetical protein NNJEOMEG_00049 [Fundidesulfovibrio magnetotacticus]|uniref:Uncharacterized protein n=1 Tax=Fundidesulfovibrio magnetotacticus TaxID=2730080 RepID=A0A6V8LRK7_9BACT|nr:hypothetical protein [Fundidesulfovibrio magnetotacticus]GFK92227.1 hypothetical protein NNJEOMEG_00049 [Fundidesulfovibrio magnetotacticus]
MSKLNAIRLEALYGFMDGRTCNLLDDQFFRAVRDNLGISRAETDKIIDELAEAGRVELSVSCDQFVTYKTNEGATCAR